MAFAVVGENASVKELQAAVTCIHVAKGNAEAQAKAFAADLKKKQEKEKEKEAEEAAAAKHMAELEAAEAAEEARRGAADEEEVPALEPAGGDSGEAGINGVVVEQDYYLLRKARGSGGPALRAGRTSPSIQPLHTCFAAGPARSMRPRRGKQIAHARGKERTRPRRLQRLLERRLCHTQAKAGPWEERRHQHQSRRHRRRLFRQWSQPRSHRPPRPQHRKPQ